MTRGKRNDYKLLIGKIFGMWKVDSLSQELDRLRNNKLICVCIKCGNKKEKPYSVLLEEHACKCSRIKIDLTGKIFGKLTIKGIDKEHPDKKRTRWIGECTCGDVSSYLSYNLEHMDVSACKQCSRNFLDLTGFKNGVYTVLKRVENSISPSGKSETTWECECSICGNKRNFISRIIVKENFGRKCRCVQGCENMIGWKFGKLTVKEFLYSKNGIGFWRCLCDCGEDTITPSSGLKAGYNLSCGCLSTSFIASQLLKYCEKKWKDTKKEYRILRNPETGFFLPYDIFLPTYNLFIEVNGEQHYKKWTFDKSDDDFEYRKRRDSYKKEFAEQNGYFLEIDLRKIKTIEQAIEYLENYLDENFR